MIQSFLWSETRTSNFQFDRHELFTLVTEGRGHHLRANLDTLSSRANCRPYQASLLAFRVPGIRFSLYPNITPNISSSSSPLNPRRRRLVVPNRERRQRAGSRWFVGWMWDEPFLSSRHSIVHREGIDPASLSSHIMVIFMYKYAYDTQMSRTVSFVFSY